jgi:hypothetical protein
LQAVHEAAEVVVLVGIQVLQINPEPAALVAEVEAVTHRLTV